MTWDVAATAPVERIAPSGRMAAAGDAEVWDRMIAAAIEDETISES
jgi:hypothetical protein